MKVSAKVDYACRALMELSFHWPNPNPLSINEIAQRQRIPLKFLTQILLLLKQIGLVESIRGKAGGYTLSRPPKEIKLSDIVRHFPEVGVRRGQRKTSKLRPQNIFESIWQDLDNQLQAAAEQISFEDICQKERALHAAPSYAI